MCYTFFAAINLTNLKIIKFLNRFRKKCKPVNKIFQKNVTKLSEIWVRDPGSEIQKKLLPDQDPGV
jgi:hypothetical protein